MGLETPVTSPGLKAGSNLRANWGGCLSPLAKSFIIIIIIIISIIIIIIVVVVAVQ